MPWSQRLWDRKDPVKCVNPTGLRGMKTFCILFDFFFPLKLRKFITMARKGHISLELQLPLGSCTSPKHKFTVLNKPNWKWPFLQGFLSSLYFWVTWGKGAVWEMCGWWKKQERNVSPFFFTTYYIDSSTFNFYSWLLALSSKNGCLCIFVWEHTYAHMFLATNSVWCISLGFFTWICQVIFCGSYILRRMLSTELGHLFSLQKPMSIIKPYWRGNIRV